MVVRARYKRIMDNIILADTNRRSGALAHVYYVIYTIIRSFKATGGPPRGVHKLH